MLHAVYLRRSHSLLQNELFSHSAPLHDRDLSRGILHAVTCVSKVSRPQPVFVLHRRRGTSSVREVLNVLLTTKVCTSTAECRLRVVVDVDVDIQTRLVVGGFDFQGLISSSSSIMPC